MIQFQIILEGKTGNEIPECSILESLEKFLSNDFALSGVEDNTYGPLNRGSIADLAIRQNSRELSFWEVMDSFGLVAYASLASSRTLLQRLLACLKFTLDSVDLFLLQTKKMISMNYGSSTSS